MAVQETAEQRSNVFSAVIKRARPARRPGLSPELLRGAADPERRRDSFRCGARSPERVPAVRNLVHLPERRPGAACDRHCRRAKPPSLRRGVGGDAGRDGPLADVAHFRRAYRPPSLASRGRGIPGCNGDSPGGCLLLAVHPPFAPAGTQSRARPLGADHTASFAASRARRLCGSGRRPVTDARSL